MVQERVAYSRGYISRTQNTTWNRFAERKVLDQSQYHPSVIVFKAFGKIDIFQQYSYCCLCVFTVALWYMRTTPTTNVICVRSSQFITIAETSGPPQRPHMPQNRPQWAETTLIGKFSRSWTRVGTLFDRIWWSEFCKILKHQIFALPYFLLEFCTIMKSNVC